MKKFTVIIAFVLINIVWPIRAEEIHTNSTNDLTKCMSDPNCDIRTNSNQTVADTTSDTKHANEEQGIALGQQRADKRNETTTAAPEDASDKEFNEYLEKYLADNPDAVLLKAQPNGQIENEVTKLDVTGGTGIDVVVHLFDANPTTDYLIIKSGFSTPEDSGFKVMGKITPKNKQQFKLTNSSKLFIRFYFAKNSSNNYKGYVITYKPVGEINVTTTIAPENITLPMDRLHTINVILNVPKVNQTGETWSIFRKLFMASANFFIHTNNLTVEDCKLENVTLVEIMRCPRQWPNAQNCLKVKVAIPLNPLIIDTKPDIGNNKTAPKSIAKTVNVTPLPIESAEDDETKPSAPEPELTDIHLRQMWLQFGQTLFAASGFPEFEAPNHGIILLLWTSISLGIIILFLLVLMAIWKMEVFQDYRRMSWKHSEDQHRIYKNQNMDVDISMFPSPHQIVPSLFPGDAHPGYGGEPVHNASGLPFEYVSQPISFNESDFKRKPSNEQIQNERDGVEVPFQPDIIDFNEPQGHHKIYFPDNDTEFRDSNASSSRYRPQLGKSQEDTMA